MHGFFPHKDHIMLRLSSVKGKGEVLKNWLYICNKMFWEQDQQFWKH